MSTFVLPFSVICEAIGFFPDSSGKYSLPVTQEVADELAAAALSLLPSWKPGVEMPSVTLTGAAPVWGYLVVAHALHGLVPKLTYAAPNATNGIVVFNHKAQD